MADFLAIDVPGIRTGYMKPPARDILSPGSASQNMSRPDEAPKPVRRMLVRPIGAAKHSATTRQAVVPKMSTPSTTGSASESKVESLAALSPIETLIDAVRARGEKTTAASFRCTDRMLDALAALQKDKDGTAIAIDAIASIAMRVIGDAQSAIRCIAAGRAPSYQILDVLHELSNMATIFVRNAAYEDVYDSICAEIVNLRNAMHGFGI